MNDRHTRVDMKCETCGTEFKARKERVDAGMGRFCSKGCFDIWQRENRQSSRLGKENAKTYPKQAGGYFVQWIENGKAKNEPWHNWAWEMVYGKIPENNVVEYIDGNKNNIQLGNLQLRLTQIGKRALPKIKKVKVEKEKLPPKSKIVV